MSTAPDVAVIGGGIVGAACAVELARAGLGVTIIEAAEVGGGATAAGMGHVLVMDDNPAEFALTRYSRGLWGDLAPELPSDVELDRCGTLWVAADEEEMEVVRTRSRFYADHRIRAEVLDAKALREAEPCLRPGLGGGLLVQDDCVVYAPCAARWLVEQARQLGATLLHGARVTEVGNQTLLLDNGSRCAAGMTVCAAGTWSGELFGSLPMRPRKGHLVITDRYPGFVRHQLVELAYSKSVHAEAGTSVAFNVQPRRTGQLLIGSSRQYDDVNLDVEIPVLRKVLNRAVSFLPALGQSVAIRAWTGFRASTADKLPLIGPCTSHPGVYLATGHEGLGITTSLGTARLLADLILGREPAIDPRPYAPERFYV
jgi:glycine/D-amino acid oxidase-like deaminating enzyme